MDSNSFYVVWIRERQGNFRARVLALHPDHIVAATQFSDDEVAECCLRLQDLSRYAFRWTQFYRAERADFKGPKRFVFSQVFFVAKLMWIKEAISQRIYNSRARFIRERMAVLQKILERDLSADRSSPGKEIGWSQFDLLSDMYSMRIFLHPNYNAEARRFFLLLDSLVDSGDMVRNGNSFRVCARAMTTIANYEIEGRRHRIAVLQNWIIIILTIVLAASAVLEIFGYSAGQLTALPTEEGG